MLKMVVRGWFLVMLLPTWFLLPGQTEYQVVQISLEDGLSQSSINAVAQDEKGFLWIGTQDGLNMYDGHNFTVHKTDPFDSTSLSENFISALLIDTSGRLWVGTYHGGLNLYDPAREVFYRFKHNPFDDNSISDNNITCLEQDDAGVIWVGTSNGFNQLQIRENKGRPLVSFHRFRHYPEGGRMEKRDNIILCMTPVPSGLWVGTYRGLYKYETGLGFDEPAVTHMSEQGQNTSLTSSFIHDIIQDRMGRLWVATNNGLNRLKNDREGFDRYLVEHPDQGQPVNGLPVRDIILTKEGHLLAATSEGIYQLIFDGEKYAPEFTRLLIGEPTEKIAWLNNGTSLLLEDKLHEGLVWVGTDLSGLGMIYKKPGRFRKHNLQVDGNSTNSIRYMVEDRYGNFWVGLYGGLLWQKKGTDDYRFIDHIQLGDLQMYTESFFRMHLDLQGRLWAGTYEGPILIDYDENGPLKAIAQRYEKSCEDRGVFAFYEEKEKLYLGTFSGVNVLNKATGVLRSCPFILDTTGSRQFNYRIQSIMVDSKYRAWFGSTSGLILLEGVEGSLVDHLDDGVKIFKYDEDDRSGLMSNYINDIHEDATGTIWIGTMQGLEQVVDDGQKITFRHFTEKDGLANNVVYGILEEPGTGLLWLSTNNGLSRFDPVSEQFTNFHKRDGLQTNEFNANAYFRAPDGEMYFGGVDGLSSFHPTDIQHTKPLRPVWLTKLVTNNYEEYNLLGMPGDKLIELPYKQNSFSVHYVGLDYTDQQDLEFIYDLVGAEEMDVPVGPGTQLHFSSLSPGEYTLRVRSKSAEVNSQVGVDQVRIAILAPFWMRTWFYLLIMFLLLGMTWVFYYTLYRFKMKRVEAIERFRKQAAQDFHDELGSKLTVISMYSELTKNHLNGAGKNVEGYLDKVINTSGTLYESMKDLIWSLNPERDSLNDLYLQLKDFGEELFAHSDIVFTAEGFRSSIADHELEMGVKRHILLIFKELMNNVVKHADAAHVSLDMQTRENDLIICLTDDGRGFDFDEALETDGLGLKSTRNRAEQINANLQIMSAEPGTKICLTCQVKKGFRLLNK